MHVTGHVAGVSVLLTAVLLVVSTHGYDFGSCPELSDPIGIHPSTGAVVQAGRFELIRDDEDIVATTICDETMGWTLADPRDQQVRCTYDEARQIWLWSHQHLSQINPPQIRCSGFSPKPLEQSYTLHNYQGCYSTAIRSSLCSQVRSQLETSLPCRSHQQCKVYSVECRGDGTGSKLSVVVEPTMLGALEDQWEMLEDAARFLKESFNPVFSSGGVTKRGLGNPFDDKDPDNTTSADCLDGQKTVKKNDTHSYCVDCTAGTYADKKDADNEKCVPCPYDSYSENNTNKECSPCDSGKGTLQQGSAYKENCTDVCEVHSVDYTTSMVPEAGGRVLEGEKVTIHCDAGFYYGNRSTTEVTCNTNFSTNNSFPTSCRMITVNTPRTSIKEFSDVTLTCVVNATGTIPRFTWYKTSADTNRTERLSKNGTSSWTSPEYTISNFTGSGSNGDYYCKPDYDDPILDDWSKPITLSVLDLGMKPVGRSYVYKGDQLNLTCIMRIDPDYSKRTIEWTKNSNIKIVTGLTTRETNQSYVSVLTLYPLSMINSNFYQCSANYTNTDGTDSVVLKRRFDVIVRGFVKEPEDVSVLVGKSFQLDCKFYVGPMVNESAAVLSWEKFDDRKNSWEVTQNSTNTIITQTFNVTSHEASSTLKVRNANHTLSGRHRCVTKFKRKDEDMDYIHSEFMVTTNELGVLAHPEDKAYMVGEKAEISCKVALPDNGTDHVSVQWLKVVDPVDEPVDMSFFDSTTGVSTLIFQSVSMANATDYKCQASYVVDGKSFKLASNTASLYVRELSRELEEYTLMHIPFYYDDEGNMYNKTENRSIMHTFSCEYHGDGNVERVIWTVLSENGTEVELGINNNSANFQEGSFDDSNNTWLTTLQLSEEFITINYKASLTCQFNFSTVGKPITSTTNFMVHALRTLDTQTLSSNSTENITCNYVGTDEPFSVTWYLDDTPIRSDSDSYTIHPHYFTQSLRFDVLTVSDRTYSDPNRNISCKYTFSKPTDEMQSYTVLVYRGLYARLNQEYYLAKDNGPVMMECQLGVGADGSAPAQTSWYFKGTEIGYPIPSFSISTDTTPTNGLFKSHLTVSDSEISPFLAGDYTCAFIFKDGYSSEISSQTILHTRMPLRRPTEDVVYGYSPNHFPLTCTVLSDETPEMVIWSGPSNSVIDNAKKEEKIVEGNLTLTYYILNLTSPSSDDSGAYTCTFDFESGPSVHETFPDVQFNDIEIANQPRVYATASGVTVRLECSVTSHKLLKLGWYDIDHDDWITPTNRTYEDNVTNAYYNLEVNSVDDRGNFTCVLLETQYTGISDKNISVIVLDLYPSFSGVVVGDQGDEVILSCELDYYDDMDTPTIEWFKDGSKYEISITNDFSLETDKYVSELKLVLEEDIANKKYHCVGRYSNIGAASDLVSENVTILMTQMVPEQEYVITAVHDDESLTCTAYSKRQETISWRITNDDGSSVDITENVETLNTSSTYVSRSVLRLTDVQMSNSSRGIECWFQPEAGSEKVGTITLDVFDVKTTGREVPRGQAASLTCTAKPSFTASDDLMFEWFFTNANGTEMQVPENETLSRGNKSELRVERNNDTEYRCMVSSRVHSDGGNASRAASFYVFDIISPKDAVIEVGEPAMLKCEVEESNGTLSFSWFKKGNNNSLYNSTGGSAYSEYKFAPESYEETGLYYCEVMVEFDGSSNGPFKSEMASLIVREVQPSFKSLTLVHKTREETLIEKLECKYYGDIAGIALVQWETPAGNFTHEDYAEFIQVDDQVEENSYTTFLSYNRSVENNDKLFCDFNMLDGDLIRKRTKSSLFSFTELYKYTYNPSQISFTYNGDVESKVTWSMNGEDYDESKHAQFTVVSPKKVNETSVRFMLNVNMSKFEEGAEPVAVKGEIKFENESVTVPHPEKHVLTKVFKRDFIEELDDDIQSVNEAEKTFSCVVAGENNKFVFSWFIGNTELRDEDDNIIISDEVKPVDSKTSRTTTLTIKDLNTSPLYNDELRCMATWQEPEPFSVQSVADLNTVGASMEPQFFTQMDGSAALTCLVWGNDAPKRVVWKNKDGEEVEHKEGMIEIENETMKKEKNDVHKYMLKFVGVQPANEGTYTCTVTFQDDSEKEMETVLSFIGASFERESPYFVHELSQSIQFTCNYRGFREPNNVTWFMGSEDEGDMISNSSSLYEIHTEPFNEDFNTQESTITIKSAKIESSGKYICKWETDDLNVSATMVLAVRTLKPKVDVFYSTRRSIYLECEYRGLMEGEMKWYYESKLLTEDKRTSIKHGTFENNTQMFNLSISEVTLTENAGSYSCSLSFQDGDTMSADTEVVVRESAIFSDYMSYDDVTQPLVFVEDDMLEMQCQLKGDVIPNNVQWFQDSTEIMFDGLSKTMVNAISGHMSWGVEYFSNITLKKDVANGNYKCKFSFSDKDEASGSEKTSSTLAQVTVLTVDVIADKTCSFVDYQQNANASLGCSLDGEIDSSGVEIKASLMYLPDGKVRSLSVSNNIDYNVVNVTNGDDGIYECAFVMNSEGHPEFSTIQRLTARKAVLTSSRRKLVSGTTFILTCTIQGGAKSISWYNNGVEIRDYKALDDSNIEGENGLMEQMSVALKVKNIESGNNNTQSFTCRGEIYDEFCPEKRQFDSAALAVEVISAVPLEHPTAGFAYQGESHEFTCKFPDAGDGELYNVYWMFNGKRILTNGDYYENGKLIIDGKIMTFANTSGNVVDIIETRYKILMVDSRAKGEYKCRITWRNGVMIKSDPARLSIREISAPPSVTNVVLGASATLSCGASGDTVAQITFYKAGEGDSNSTMIDGATQRDESNQGSVLTVGEVELQDADETSQGYYYCNVTWGERSLTSDPVYLNVFTTHIDKDETWGVLGSVVRVECLSDAALRIDENRTSYLDDKDKVVFAQANVSWNYKGPSDTEFKTIDDDIEHFLESPWIGFDGYRRSGIVIGPIEMDYDNYEFHCSVDYNDGGEAVDNFFGGSTFSEPTKLRISQILSFEPTETEVITGETFQLTCTAIGEIEPTFRISNDGRHLDTSRYIIKSKSFESPNALLHKATYDIETRVATVLQAGQNFYCSVDFGSSTAELTKKVKVTTYYNCTKAEITVLGKPPSGQEIVFEDNGDDRTAKVKCPANTTNSRYSVYESTQAKKESQCTKQTGVYYPPYLATCLVTHPFVSGTFEQVWSLKSAGGTYCADETVGEFSKENITDALRTKNSVCGPYPIVPCLKDSECTLNVTNTGCRWDDSEKKLHVYYQVDFNGPIWSIQKRKELTIPSPGTKIKFWSCPESLQSPKKRTLSKRGRLLETMVADKDSDAVILEDHERSYSTLGIGVAGFMVAVIFVSALLYKRRYSRGASTDMVIGTEAFEMTQRSLVLTNPHSLSIKQL